MINKQKYNITEKGQKKYAEKNLEKSEDQDALTGFHAFQNFSQNDQNEEKKAIIEAEKKEQTEKNFENFKKRTNSGKISPAQAHILNEEILEENNQKKSGRNLAISLTKKNTSQKKPHTSQENQYPKEDEIKKFLAENTNLEQGLQGRQQQSHTPKKKLNPLKNKKNKGSIAGKVAAWSTAGLGTIYAFTA